MEIGRLDRRLSIEQETLTPDGGGGFDRGWNVMLNLWGRVVPLGGRERMQGPRVEPAVSHRITIRRREDVTAAMRVRCDGRVFNIRFVMNGGKQDPFTELFCEEHGAT